MLKIYNYQELKSLFTKAEDGTNRRKNKFVFEQLRYPEYRRWLRGENKNNKDWIMGTDDDALLRLIRFFPDPEMFGDGTFALQIDGFNDFRPSKSPDIKTRENCIAYSREGHPAVRERASVLMLKSIEQHGMFPVAPKVANRVAEIFASDWKAYIRRRETEANGFTLHISGDEDAFDAIYNSDYQSGDFHSCMTNVRRWSLYLQSGAKAAYLCNAEGLIVARAIYWTCARDKQGNTYRYLDRLYSSNGDESLQRLLLSQMRERGLIDLYKPVGAACSDAKHILTVDDDNFDSPLGVELRGWKSYNCPYMDTFKYGLGDMNEAWNDAKEVWKEAQETKCDHIVIMARTDGRSDTGYYSEDLHTFIETVCCVDTGTYVDRESAYYAEDTDRYYESDDDLCYAEDTDRYYESDDDLFYAEDTDRYYESAECLYYTEDTERYYKSAASLYYTEDTEKYYEYNDDLFYAVDTEEYYKYADELCYAEDTDRYFTSDDDLFYAEDTGMYYEYDDDLYCVSRLDGTVVYYAERDGIVKSKIQQSWILTEEAIYIADLDDYDFVSKAEQCIDKDSI